MCGLAISADTRKRRRSREDRHDIVRASQSGRRVGHTEVLLTLFDPGWRLSHCKHISQRDGCPRRELRDQYRAEGGIGAQSDTVSGLSKA